MTEGNIVKQLVFFSIPLILGNLFQLTYNAVDSIIVGKFLGESALAAVGTANPVMSIVILGINGICIGASVLMSEYFGAKKVDELKKEVSTTLLFGCFFSLVIVVIGLLFSGLILKLMDVPDEILTDATHYLKVIFLGMPFTYLYNSYAAAMRSVGDSKTPVKFLAFASILNAGLDYILVGHFHWDIIGCAVTTDIAECVSAILCVLYVYRKVPLLRLKKQELAIDRKMLKLTLQNGSITALQQSCVPIGKLLVQGTVNSLGVSTIAAFNAVNRVDDFAFVPEQSISHSMMTFVAQNRGAERNDRVKKGLSNGLFIEFCYWVIICILVFTLRKFIMELFASEGEAGMIDLGVDYLGIMAFFYIFPGFTNGIQGFFRGMGNMKVTLIATALQMSIRVVLVNILVPQYGMVANAYSSLIGWCCMLLFEVPYYLKFKRQVL